MNPRVLLIDDDHELVELLRDYLSADGFAVSTAHDGASGCAAAIAGGHDIVVLDVMMPGLSGLAVLRRLRASSHVPVIMLTARGDDADRIDGLELGADDYVPKPCTPRELAARLRAILRRTGTGEAAGGLLQVDALTLDSGLRLAHWQGRELPLTGSEFNLLEVLAQHAGQPVSKADLSQQGLGRSFTRYDRSIDVHISSIRQKLPLMADGRSRIQTVFRKGYQLLREQGA